MTSLFIPISKDAKTKLWKHQREAIEFAIGHLNRYSSSCLIRMPTGTGKTGVIACLTKLSNPGTSLVLTPWANLRNQMVDELEKTFWQKRKITDSSHIVASMYPSTAGTILKDEEPQVIIATFATLNVLRLDYRAQYDELAKRVSLVVVDEGHYEPAVEWGKSVKGLRAKTVLLTATPYRNDLKLFRIKNPKESTHHFTHKEATEGKIVRRIRFDELACSTIDILDVTDAFAKAWKAAKANGELPSSEPRAIICCMGHEQIEKVVTRLATTHNLEVIGIHERFEDSGDARMVTDVPSSSSSAAEIWV